ncbi:hypothetical protein BVRB_042940, partial [Beta vulgaris subsp. vulgaris]
CQLCICVGVPYAPTQDPIINATFKHLDDIGSSDVASVTWSTLHAMQIVNQALARLYNFKDKLALLLLDQRYENPREQSCLPDWLRQQLKPSSDANM